MRWTAFGLYVVGCVLFVRDQGIPTDRIGIALAILALLTIAVLGRGWAAWWQMMRDWVPFEAVLLLYDYSRGFAAPYSAAQVAARQYPVVDVHNSLGLPAPRDVPDPGRPVDRPPSRAWAGCPRRGSSTTCTRATTSRGTASW